MNLSEHDKDIDDLLSNDSFRSWVLNPDPELNLFWGSWLVQNPEKAAKVKEARILVKALQYKEGKLSEDRSARLFDRIKKTNELREKKASDGAKIRPLNDNVHNVQQGKKNVPMRYLFRYAAILAGALVFALSVHLLSGERRHEKKVEIVEKINERGQKATIFLPDGSIVTLNSASKLVYPKVFAKDMRKVYLQGEAFFEVSKAGKPFIVETDHLNARVLGTSFSVKAYPASEESSVSLLTGKVAVYPAESEEPYQAQLVLLPGEKGSLNNKKATLVKTNYDYYEEIAWKDGVLLFRNTPLEEAIARMELWYGMEFVVDKFPKGEEYYVTGRFDNESLQNVLKSISFTAKFDYQVKRNKIYLNFQNQ